jgi:hypothetical protein
MAMPAIMADHDVEGQLEILQSIWFQPGWIDLWSELDCRIESFGRLGIPINTPDVEIWRMCQRREIILITGNRNAEDEESLEVTIRREGKPDSLPIYAISDAQRLTRDRNYAEQVAARVLDYMRGFDNLRGAGRLYLP